MFYKKEGFPEEGELVMCTVKKILSHSVFVILEEYRNKEGMLHIAEISPGRIRNIRDFVKQGKKIICKVLRINRERNHIDVSLRRVSVSMRKKKNTEYKQEEKAEKILEAIAKKLKIDLETAYKKIGNQLTEEYDSLYNAFQSFIEEETDFKELKIPEKELEILKEILKEKIKPIKVEIKSKLKISTNAPDGIKIIKTTINEIKKFTEENKYETEFSYISAPRYSLTITSSDYKSAEKAKQEIHKKLTELAKKHELNIEISK